MIKSDHRSLSGVDVLNCRLDDIHRMQNYDYCLPKCEKPKLNMKREESL